MKCLKSQTGKQLQSNFIGYCMANSEDLEIAKGDQSLLILKNTSHAAKTGLYLHTFIPAKNVQSHSLSWLKKWKLNPLHKFGYHTLLSAVFLPHF